MLYKTFDQLNGKKLKDTDQIELLNRVFIVGDIINSNWLDFESFIMDESKLDMNQIQEDLGCYITTMPRLECVLLAIFALLEKLNVQIKVGNEWKWVIGNGETINIGDLNAVVGEDIVSFKDNDETYFTIGITKLKPILKIIIETNEEKSIDIGYRDRLEITKYMDDLEYNIGCKALYLESIKELLMAIS